MSIEKEQRVRHRKNNEVIKNVHVIEIYIYTMMCCLLSDLSAVFVRAHTRVYTEAQRTRQH